MDFEELEELDASEIHAKRVNAKELTLPERVKIANIAVADGTVQSYGRNQGLKINLDTQSACSRRKSPRFT